MNVKKLNGTELDWELRESGREKTVVVEFYADWCGPCKTLTPIYEELSKEMTEIFFGKINVEEEAETAQKYAVRSVPTVLVFKNGQQTAKSKGFVSKDILRRTIREASVR